MDPNSEIHTQNVEKMWGVRPNGTAKNVEKQIKNFNSYKVEFM